MQFPGLAADIAAAHTSPTSYVVRASRSGLMINEQAPKSSGHFHCSIPDDYTTTNPGNTTNRQAATSAGVPLNLERKNFADDMTSRILDENPYGQHYVGSDSLASGKGLKESELDRTHHLSDSSIRIIVQAFMRTAVGYYLWAGLTLYSNGCWH